MNFLKRRIDKYIYKAGINVALTHFENSKIYKSQIKAVEAGLLRQVDISEGAIHNLMLFTKADKNEGLVTQIQSYVVSIAEYVGFKEFLLKAGSAGGQAALDKLGIDGKFVLKNEQITQFFEDRERLLIKSVDDTTKEWLAMQIQKGKDNLLNPKEIAALITDNAKEMSAMRSELIVLTETANALSTVELETARRNGIREIIWRTSVDERVCPICLPLEGMRASIGQAFNGAVSHPPAHPRCRCFMEEVIPLDWTDTKFFWLGD